MKYIVHWHDAETDCAGTPTVVEAGAPEEAYAKAADELSGTVSGFSAGHIEMLVDERGKRHDPDVFLVA